MKKVLLIHNNYQIKGGEDTNLEEEIKFLKKNYELEVLLFDNSQRINVYDLVTFMTGRNLQSDKKILKKINKFNPDIVYIHNTWFKIGFGIFKLLEKKQIKTILKIHNFRYECSRYWLLKNHIGSQDFCNACALTKRKLVFFNKYFEDSFIKSVISIIFSKRYYKTLKHSPISIAVISDFQKEYLVNSGIDSDKVFLHRNPFNFSVGKYIRYNSKSNFIVYAGRLTDSKGIEELLKAWVKLSINNIKLKIVGDGELNKTLQKKYNINNVDFCGELNLNDTLDIIAGSRAVVTTTKMYEGQPRLLTEASFYCVPSIFPSFGGMGELFPNDYPLKFNQYNYSSLEDKLNLIQASTLLESLSVSVKNTIDNLLDERVLNDSFERMIDK